MNHPGKCDLIISGSAPLRIEIKMARFFGDNGKPDGTGIKDILSPFAADRSAVADAAKLIRGAPPGRGAILICRLRIPCIGRAASSGGHSGKVS
jgi:hypothetical protein